jgi:hypothetical protein
LQNLKVYIVRFVEYPLLITISTSLIRIISEISISVKAISILNRYVDKQRNILMRIKEWKLTRKKKESKKINPFNLRRISVKNKINQNLKIEN